METDITDEIRMNRLNVIAALTKNPMGFKQIKGHLMAANNERCAVGLMGEALHCSPVVNGTGKVYSTVEKKLGLIEGSSFIFNKNDRGWSFAEIAEYLKEIWGL